MVCQGKAWVGWRYVDCRMLATVRSGEQVFCSRCFAEAVRHADERVAPTHAGPDESAIAADQLAARIASRLAERMSWPGCHVESGKVVLSLEQAVDLVERLG